MTYRIPDDEKEICHQICQSGKYETGEGTCALICMDQLGDPRRKLHGCPHAVKVFKHHARIKESNQKDPTCIRSMEK